MPEYNWPTKVRKFGLESIFQRILVAKYENLIDWNGERIESAGALDEHLREVMLPKLKRRITQEDKKSYYCRSIDLEKMLQNPAPHIQEARTIRDQQSPDTARRFLMDHINEHKKLAFEGWWKYLTEENPHYAEHPAFQYLLLRPVIDSSNAKCTRSAIPVNAEAVALLHDQVEKGEVDPTQNLLGLLCEFIAFGGAQAKDRPNFGTLCGWVSVHRNEPNAAERVSALSQGSGWCVAASSMASHYLRSSDFHILLENGKPVTAIRTAEGRAVEIQGRGNGDPGDWWPRILMFIKSRGVSIQHRGSSASQAEAQYKQLIASHAEVALLRDHLQEHPAQVLFVDPEVEENPAFQPIVHTAWKACIAADPICAGLAPDTLTKDPDLQKKIIESWKDLLQRDPYSFDQVPLRLQKLPDIQASIQNAWVKVACRKLEADPLCWDKVPDDLRQREEIQQARVSGWTRSLDRRPEDWANVPDDLRQREEIQQARVSGWTRSLDRRPEDWANVPEDLRQREEIQQARVSGWTRSLGQNPEVWGLVPKFLLEWEDIQQARVEGWQTLLSQNPKAWDECPEDMQVMLQDHIWDTTKKYVRKKPQTLQERLDASTRFYNLPSNLPDQQRIQVETILALFLGNETGVFDNHLIPNKIKISPNLPDIIELAWKEAVQARPSYLLAIPPDLAGKKGMHPQETFSTRADPEKWAAKIRERPWLLDQAKTAPKSLRHSKLLLDAYVEGWGIRLRKRPNRLWHSFGGNRVYISYAVLFDPRIIDSMRDGWISKYTEGRLNATWKRTSARTARLPAVQLAILLALNKVRSRHFSVPKELLTFLESEILSLDSLSQRPKRYWDVYKQINDLLAEELRRNNIYPKRRFEVSPRSAVSDTQDAESDQSKVLEESRLKLEWEEKLLKSPRQWEVCPKAIRNIPAILAARKKGWLQLATSQSGLQKIPDDLAEDPEIQEHVLQSWRSIQDLMGRECVKWPEYIRKNNVMSRRAVVPIIRELRRNPQFWNEIPSPWREMDDVQMEAIQSWTHFPGYSDKEAPEDIRERVEALRNK
jgi:hypothetical protein